MHTCRMPKPSYPATVAGAVPYAVLFVLTATTLFAEKLFQFACQILTAG